MRLTVSCTNKIKLILFICRILGTVESDARENVQATVEKVACTFVPAQFKIYPVYGILSCHSCSMVMIVPIEKEIQPVASAPMRASRHGCVSHGTLGRLCSMSL